MCGASGIENAIKLARLYTGRHKILTRYRSYHGSTTGAMSAGGDPRRLRVDVQQAPNFVHLEIPYEYRSNGSNWRQDCFDQLDRILAYEGPENFAAIIMEGESGTSGCLKLPKGYFKKLRQVCDKHQILLISDEVMSGFGRTGQWFGINNHDVIPDSGVENLSAFVSSSIPEIEKKIREKGLTEFSPAQNLPLKMN